LSYQVGPGMWVKFVFDVFDADGEPLQDGSATQTAVFGYGSLMEAFEARLEGLMPGDRRSIELPAERAFGRRDPKAVLEVDRSEFPPDVAAGDRFDAEGDDGRPVLLQVLEVTEDAVILDTNHPLAGQRLRFEIEVQEVRPATAAELEEAEARLEAEPDLAEESPVSRLIPPESLLRPPGKR
jgi:FKBP-type peptidyl-prolyl cis-trans isomerase SlyD